MANNDCKVLGLYDELTNWLSQVNLYSGTPMNLPRLLSCSVAQHGHDKQVSKGMFFSILYLGPCFIFSYI